MLDFRGLIQITWPHDAPDGDAARRSPPGDSLALHAQARAWLESELAKPFDGKTIVVTHHAPHRQSLAEKYAEDRVSAGFVNHLPALVRAPVALWIHGHTHTRVRLHGQRARGWSAIRAAISTGAQRQLGKSAIHVGQGSRDLNRIEPGGGNAASVAKRVLCGFTPCRPR